MINKKRRAFSVALLAASILATSPSSFGKTAVSETLCYTERVTDAPSYNIYTGRNDPNNPIVWSHTVPPGILKSVIRVGLFIEAYDVDYPANDEHDRVFINGYDLGLLEGFNNEWGTVEKTVPPEVMREGINDLRIVVDELDKGWKVTIRASEIRFYCSSAEPDFSIGVTPTSLSVPQGGTTSYTVTLTSLNQFSSPVSLTVTGLPDGATSQFATNPLTPSGECALRIDTSPTTPFGTYPLTVTGTGGEKSHSADVTLVVTAGADFTIDADPPSRTVSQGGDATYTISLKAKNGFESPVDLSVENLPQGATAAFDPNPKVPTGESKMTVSTSDTTPTGTYSVTVKGIGGGKTQSCQVTLVVSSAPDYTIQATPPEKTVIAGDSATYSVNLTALNGFSSPVNLNVAGLPDGAHGQFSKNPITPSGQVDLEIMTSDNTPPGIYSLTIAGDSGRKHHAATVNLVVSPKPDFEISASPSSSVIAPSEVTTFIINLKSINGFKQPVQLSATGLPPGAGGEFKMNPVTPSGQTTLEVATTAATPTGTYSITISGEGAGMTHSTTVSLIIVVRPDFSIIATPPTQTATFGTPVVYTIQLLPVNGFKEMVELSVAGLPKGAVAEFDRRKFTPPGKTPLNVTVPAETTPGEYPITITGVGGSKTRTAVVELVVPQDICPPFSVQISATPDSGQAPLAVQLKATITEEFQYNGAYSYIWDFGDGQISTDTQPVHTYERSGVFTIHVKVTNACGDEKQAEKQIAVESFAGSIRKAFSPGEASPGETVTMSLSFQSDSTSEFQDVSVRDELPASLIYVGDTAPVKPRFEGKRIIWLFPQIRKKQRVQFDVTLRISDRATPGRITNIAYLDHESLKRPISSNTAVMKVRGIQVMLVKSVDKVTAKASDEIHYQIRLQNTSNIPLTDVIIRDELSAYLEFISQESALSFSKEGSTLLWKGHADPGAETLIAFTARITNIALSGTSVTNTASLTARELAKKMNSNMVTTVLQSEPIPLTKVSFRKRSEVPQVEVGRMVRFRLEIDNRSDSALLSPIIEDDLPQGFSYVAASTLLNTSAFNDPDGKGTLFWHLPNIPPRQITTLSYQVVIDADARRGKNVNRAVLRTRDVSGQNVMLEASEFINVSSSGFTFYSGVEGYVFLDRNKDEYFSTGDTPIEGVEVKISSGESLVTDTNGYFKEEGMNPGDYAVGVNTTTLAQNLRPSNSPMAVNLPDGFTERVDFPVRFRVADDEMSRVEGRVFYDKNGDGAYGPGDPLAADFQARLDGTMQTAGAAGRFVFTDLTPGNHTIEIIYTGKTMKKEVVLTPGQTTIDIPLKFSGIIITISGEVK